MPAGTMKASRIAARSANGFAMRSWRVGEERRCPGKPRQALPLYRSAPDDGHGARISQYISLALYLSPPPALETTVELTEMPPDSTQVVEIVPLLRDFAEAVDLHGIWLAAHHPTTKRPTSSMIRCRR